MKTSKQLINNIVGQLEAVGRMMSENKDCFDVIIQMKAARSSMDSAMQKFIEENFAQCSDACKGNKEKERMKKLLSTLIRK